VLILENYQHHGHMDNSAWYHAMLEEELKPAAVNAEKCLKMEELHMWLHMQLKIFFTDGIRKLVE